MGKVTDGRLAGMLQILKQKREWLRATSGQWGCDTDGEELISILRELQRLREQTRWRPMEEAPKDGSHVLLYRPHIRFVGYHSDAGWCINAPGLPLMQPEPTDWMPLPEIGPLPGGDA